MSYDAPGQREEKEAVRACVHGQLVVIKNQVGVANKVSQLGRYVDPQSAAVTAIEVGETITLMVTGKHEVPLTGGLNAAVEGDRVYIDPDNDTLRLHGAKTAGDIPAGIISEIDPVRDVGRINLNTLHAFFPSA